MLSSNTVTLCQLMPSDLATRKHSRQIRLHITATACPDSRFFNNIWDAFNRQAPLTDYATRETLHPPSKQRSSGAQSAVCISASSKLVRHIGLMCQADIFFMLWFFANVAQISICSRRPLHHTGLTQIDSHQRMLPC